MKKLTIPMLIALAAATAYAEPIKGGSSERTAITAGDAIEIDSTGGNRYTAASGVTVGSLTEIDGSTGGVNIAAWGQDTGLTVDANSTDAKTALKVASWKQNYAITTITNSASSTAAITVDFGQSLTLNANYNKQSQYLNFKDVYAKVLAKNTFLQEQQGTSDITIAEGAKVDWSGSIRLGEYYGKTNNANLNVNGEFNLQRYNGNKSQIDLYDGTKLTIGSNGVLRTSDNTINIFANGSLTVNGQLVMQGGSTLNVGGTLNIAKQNPTKRFAVYSMNSAGGTFAQDTANSDVAVGNRGLEIKRTATLNANTATGKSATWYIDSRLDLNGDYNADINLTTAKLTVNDDSQITISGGEKKFVMWNISKAYLNKANAIVDENGEGNISLITADRGEGFEAYVPELHIAANQQFSEIWLGQDFKIFLDDNAATLELTKTGDTTISGFAGKIVEIYNFADNRIYVGTDAATKAQLSRIKAYDSDNNLVNIAVNGAGWLTAAIPEPAEWAAIFGAAALAVAVIRRRK